MGAHDFSYVRLHEAKIYENYTDEEIKDKVLQHCKCWGITECEAECRAEENEPKKISISHWIKRSAPNGDICFSCYLCGCLAPRIITADSWLWKFSTFCPNCGAIMEVNV